LGAIFFYYLIFFQERIEKENFSAKCVFFPAKTLTLWQTKKLAFKNLKISSTVGEMLCKNVNL
jgi:hypothetical protein